MPQLSPMLGFVMFLFVLTLLFVFLCGMSKKPTMISSSKMEASSKSSFTIFNLWNGSMMPKL